MTTNERNPPADYKRPAVAEACCHPLRHGLEERRNGDKKFRLSERLREARYFPHFEYRICLAVVPVAAGGYRPMPQLGAF